MIPSEAKQATKETLADLPAGSYVYFIVRDGECVYVGQTKTLRRRLQRNPHRMKTDIVYFLHVDEGLRLSTESEWIARLKPQFNMSPGTGRPPKVVKEINPVRVIGRWPDSDWDLIRAAAKDSGKTVAQWAREILLRAARRSG